MRPRGRGLRPLPAAGPQELIASGCIEPNIDSPAYSVEGPTNSAHPIQ